MNRREIRHVLAVLAARVLPVHRILLLYSVVVAFFTVVLFDGYYQEQFVGLGEVLVIGLSTMAPGLIFGGLVLVVAMLGKRESFLAVLQDARPAVGSARLLMAAMLASLTSFLVMIVLMLVWLVCTQAFLLAKRSGGDGLAASLQQVRLEDYAFVPDITLILLLCAFFMLPLAVFMLWSLINARPGYLRSCWHNLPNLACCAVVLAGYWLVASFAGFSFFEPGNPPALLFGYLALAALCYSLAASRAVRTAAADPARLYFSELWIGIGISRRKPRRLDQLAIKFDRWLKKNSWFTPLVFVVLIVWRYYVR